MLEEYHTDGWNIAKMEYPFERGINLSVETDEIETTYKRIKELNYHLYRPLTINEYESGGNIIVQKEFLVHDHDGYLLRITQE